MMAFPSDPGEIFAAWHGHGDVQTAHSAGPKHQATAEVGCDSWEFFGLGCSNQFFFFQKKMKGLRIS